MSSVHTLFLLVSYGLFLLGDVGVHAFQFKSINFMIGSKPYSLRDAAISPINRLMCSSLPSSNPKTNYLKLKSGMQISRIVTVTTTRYDVILKLCQAVTRNEIMKTCLVRHKRTCTIFEHQKLPISCERIHTGWSFEQRDGSSIKACSGIPGSVLWVTDVHSCNTSQVQVGSWLMSKLDIPSRKGMSSLFTQTDSRIGSSFQSMTLIRPGFAKPDVVSTPYGPHFVITFIEIQNCDELGIATRPRY